MDLFLVYINDIVLHLSSTRLFADDYITCFYSVAHIADIQL